MKHFFFFSSFYFVFILSIHSQCISNFTDSNSACDTHGEYYKTINFDVSGSPIGPFTASWMIGNLTLTETFSLTDLPVTIGPFPGNCNAQNIAIANSNNSCTFTAQQLMGQCCTSSPCSLDNLDHSIECNADGTAYYRINGLDVTNGSSVGGVIHLLYMTNGSIVDSLNFQYSDIPFDLNFPNFTIEGQCLESIYRLEIYDQHRDCAIETEVENACCYREDWCHIEEVISDFTGGCYADNTFDLLITIFNFYTGNVFDLWVENQYYGQFTSSPVSWYNNNFTIPNFSPPSNREYLSATLCAAGDATCCHSFEIYNLCYVPCQITQITAEADSSSCSTTSQFINFTIEAENFGEQGYSVNGINFQPGDEQVIEVFADCETPLILYVVDNIDNQCEGNLEFGPVCCPCLLDYNIELDTCYDGYVDILFNTYPISGSCLIDDIHGWTLNINGIRDTLSFLPDVFIIDSLSINDSLIIVELCTMAPTGECFVDTLINPCYVYIPCNITDFVVEQDSVSCIGELLSTTFSFNSQNFGSQGFKIVVEPYGEIFEYQIGDNYELFLFSNCMDNYIITIIDNIDTTCRATFDFGQACCPCEIDFDVTASACTNGCFDAEIIVNYVEGSCVTFDSLSLILEVDGMTLSVPDDGSTLTVSNICSTDSVIAFTICVDGSPDECTTQYISNPCYVVDSVCHFISFNPIAFIDSCVDNEVYITFEYQVENPGLTGYTLLMNNDTLASGTYPNIISLWVPSFCDSNAVFTIIDNDDANCFDTQFLDICCEEVPLLCVITDFEIELETLNDDDLQLRVFFGWSPNQGTDETGLLTLQNTEITNRLVFNGSTVHLANYTLDSLMGTVCFPECLDTCISFNVLNPLSTSVYGVENSTLKVISGINQMSVVNSTSSDAHLEIYSMQGILLIKKPVKVGRESVEINNLISGIYFVRLYNNDHEVNKKIAIIAY